MCEMSGLNKTHVKAQEPKEQEALLNKIEKESSDLASLIEVISGEMAKLPNLTKAERLKFKKEAAKGLALGLVDYFNHPQRIKKASDMPDSGFKKIETMFRTLTELRRRESEGDLISADDPGVKLVNDVLAKHKWITQLNVGGSHLSFVESADAWSVEEIRNGESLTNFHCGIIITLAKFSMLDRIRTCAHCDIWFFGTGTYCSPKCKQAAYRGTPEFKAHANAYQKKYYKDVLSPVTGWAARQRRRSRRSKG